MSHPVATIDVSGTTPGADTNTDTMFTTTDQPMRSFFAMAGIRRAILKVAHDQNGTLKWYDSPDGGTTWNQVGSHTATAVSNESTVVDILVDGHRDWKIEWTNGGSAQGATLWDARLTLSCEVSPAA